MQSLYERNPAVWDKVADQGFHFLREVAKRSDMPADMDRAIGTVNAAAKWQRGVSRPRNWVETAAKAWINTQTGASLLPEPPPTPTGSYEVTASKRGTSAFVVVCNDGDREKVLRVLTLLNCAVEEL